MSKKIAVCFFGITRSLSFTIDSIRKNVIAPARELGKVNIFCHFFYQDKINNPRSGESVELNPEEYKLLEADSVILQEPNSFLSDSCFKEVLEFGDAFGDGNYSTKNLFHQLNSLSQVTGAAQSWGADIVVFVRPDLYYHDSFKDIIKQAINSVESKVIIPNWQHWDGINDRFAIAVGQAAIESYGLRYDKILKFCNETKFPLHSERLLQYSLSNVEIQLTKLRASRIRANGTRKEEIFLHYRIFDMHNSIAARLKIDFKNAILTKFTNLTQNIVFGNPYKNL